MNVDKAIEILRDYSHGTLFNLGSNNAINISNFIKQQNVLAELGKLSLATQICYYNYNYADGDCQEGKCERNEFCKLRNEMLNGGK